MFFVDSEPLIAPPITIDSDKREIDSCGCRAGKKVRTFDTFNTFKGFLTFESFFHPSNPSRHTHNNYCACTQ